MTIEHLPAEAFKPSKDVEYVDVNKLHPLFDKVAFQSNLILVGPKGVGKSSSIAAWAGATDVPVVTFDCSEDVRRAHLLGTFVLRGDQTPFVLGPLTTAFEIANAVGKCVLILEEINALTPQMQKVLNPLGDFRKRIEVPEANKVFELREGAQLWVTGTMNTAVYSGVYQLNEDLKSRFRLIPIEYPEENQEKAILASFGDESSPKLYDRLVTLARDTRQNNVSYPLSTRDLAQIVHDEKLVGLPVALWMASGKFEGAERKYFLDRVKSVFGLKIDSKAG